VGGLEEVVDEDGGVMGIGGMDGGERVWVEDGGLGVLKGDLFGYEFGVIKFGVETGG